MKQKLRKMLREAIDSKHALERVQSRILSMTDVDMAQKTGFLIT